MMLVDSIDVTFVYEKEDEVEVPVRIQLLGRPADFDRAVDITVSSDNAVEGLDYILPEDAMIPAGTAVYDYPVRLLRTEGLKSEKKRLTLTLHENSDFNLPVKEMVQSSAVVSALSYTISFSDMFTKAPAAWDENLIGAFSQQKFELICDVLDMDPADFNDTSVITLAKLLYISAEMTVYVKEEVSKKEDGLPYDENVFDAVTGLPLDFGR